MNSSKTAMSAPEDELSEALKQQRIYPWPQCRKTAKGFIVKARCLTPLRMVLLHEIINPLKFLWKWATFLVVLDFILLKVRIFSVFYFIPFITWEETAITVAIMLALYLFEAATTFSICRLIFGCTLIVEFLSDDVIVKRGWFKSETYSRSTRISFGSEPIQESEHTFYRDSRFFYVAINDKIEWLVSEVYSVKAAKRVATNCNHFCDHSRDHHERDVDPRLELLN